jgi:hypothetical protein
MRITFQTLSLNTSREDPEFGLYRVPDFWRFWLCCHLYRNISRCAVEKQVIDLIEGNYLISCNENLNFQRMHTLNELGIDCIDSARRFYYGDLFILKFTQNPRVTVNAVCDILEVSLLEITIVLIVLCSRKWHDTIRNRRFNMNCILQRRRSSWRRTNNLRSEDVCNYKPETGTELLKEGRAPVDRQLHEQIPSNTLEWCAMQSCNDNAFVSTNRTQPSDPNIVNIEVVRRPRVLDSTAGQDLETRNWEGGNTVPWAKSRRGEVVVISTGQYLPQKLVLY